MAVIAEFVFIIKRETEEPTFKQPKWLQKKNENRITWKMIKKELFSSKKEKKEGEEEGAAEEDDDEEEEEEEESSDDDEAEMIHRLDCLHDEASSDESDTEGVAARGGSSNKSRYRPS